MNVEKVDESEKWAWKWLEKYGYWPHRIEINGEIHYISEGHPDPPGKDGVDGSIYLSNAVKS